MTHVVHSDMHGYVRDFWTAHATLSDPQQYLNLHDDTSIIWQHV
jgi:hypothetical protein